jgi:hypothetical protein
MTAECLKKCYDDKLTNRIQVDECARRCKKPFKKQQQANSNKVLPCEDGFETGMRICNSGKTNLSYDGIKKLHMTK